MQAIKFVLVAVLAVCATQCQADEFPISADKLDLRLLVENGAAIAKKMFTAINGGLDQAKPHMDKILAEMAPEARTLAQKLIASMREKINEEDKRITHIFATLNNNLDRLKPIKPCSDKVSPAAKKLALATEKEVAGIIVGVQNKYKKELEAVKAGAKKILDAARKLFDVEAEEVVKCLKPGNKEAGNCLTKCVDRIVQGTIKIALEAVVLAQGAADSLKPILPEVIEKIVPLVEKTTKDAKVIIKTLTDCVSALK